MRQVPQEINYLLVGDGRLAKHLHFYFESLGLSLSFWNRKQPTADLQIKSLDADVILLAIKDDAIQSFIDEHSFLKQETLVHFSGSLSLDGVYGAHPLMTFSQHLYEIDRYKKMSWVIDFSKEKFADLFPQLSNPVHEISSEKKALYHSLCVMGGNFTVLLWQKLFSDLENRIGVSPTAAEEYLKAICENIITHPQTALTGPISRNDQITIQKNLNALEGDPYQDIYKDFVRANSLLNTEGAL